MIDTQHFRDMYDSEIESFGRVVSGVGIFDRRILWPRLSVPALVERESGHLLTLEDLDRMANDGLFSWLGGAGNDGTELGIPMYVPWRIALFAQLESGGWTREELREATEWEEWVITDCLTTDHLTYEDEDTQTVITHVRSMLDDVENELDIRNSAKGGPIDRIGRSWSSRNAAKSTEELEDERRRHERLIDKLRTTDSATASNSWRRHVEREAYVIRQWQEMMRVLLIQGDRARLEAGFNRAVTFRGIQQLCPDPKDYAAFGTISWRDTLNAWAVRDDPDHYPIRLPGFVLTAGRITLEAVLTPGEYAQRHELFGLADYPEAFKELMGERRCAHCQGLLPRGAHQRRRYCSDECSNAARQRRFRENQKAQILRRRNAPES